MTSLPTQSIRERLARAMFCDTDDCPASEWERAEEGKRNIYRSNVDAILSELMEPSEGMIDAALVRMNAKGVVCEDDEIRHYQHIYGAMIQHIRSGGK